MQTRGEATEIRIHRDEKQDLKILTRGEAIEIRMDRDEEKNFKNLDKRCVAIGLKMHRAVKQHCWLCLLWFPWFPISYQIVLIDNKGNLGFHSSYFRCQATKYRNKPTPFHLYEFISLQREPTMRGTFDIEDE